MLKLFPSFGSETFRTFRTFLHTDRSAVPGDDGPKMGALIMPARVKLASGRRCVRCTLNAQGCLHTCQLVYGNLRPARGGALRSFFFSQTCSIVVFMAKETIVCYGVTLFKPSAECVLVGTLRTFVETIECYRLRASGRVGRF